MTDSTAALVTPPTGRGQLCLAPEYRANPSHWQMRSALPDTRIQSQPLPLADEVNIAWHQNKEPTPPTGICQYCLTPEYTANPTQCRCQYCLTPEYRTNPSQWQMRSTLPDTRIQSQPLPLADEVSIARKEHPTGR